MLAALAGEDVIGWCDIHRHGFPFRAHRGTLGMGLVAEWRGRGVGSALIGATLSEALRLGFQRIELDVNADNSGALTLYEKAGFVRGGLARDASLIDGVYRDAIVMAIVKRASAEG